MSASTRLPHVIVGAVIVIALVFCATVQLASDALYSQAAPQTFAARIPESFGLSIYRALDAVMPASYVEDALGHHALESGDPMLAEHYAVRMPAGPRRDDLLARIAAARGDHKLVFEYDFAAGDAEALQGDVMSLWMSDRPAAYPLEMLVRQRLIKLGTHPDAVAEADFTAGSLASWSHRPKLAYEYFLEAIAIAPLDMKYVLAAGTQALQMHDDTDAARLYRLGLNIDPASGDALAGLGIVALHRGDRARAEQYLTRAQAAQPDAGMIPVLRRALQ